MLPHHKLPPQNVVSDLVLQKLLPEGVDVPSSFESIGHIAHVNLRADQLPYKALIGQVLLDKSPIIQTVVNKVGCGRVNSSMR